MQQDNTDWSDRDRAITLTFRDATIAFARAVNRITGQTNAEAEETPKENLNA